MEICVEKRFLIPYVICAASYIVMRVMEFNGIFPVIIKIIPILILLFLASQIKNIAFKKDKFFLMLALAFSLAGDAILSLKASWFVFGLGAFLVAHLFYIPLFVRHIKFDKSKIYLPIGVLIYGVMMGWFLKDINPKLVVPVYAYLAVISAMVITSVFNIFNNRILVLGTLLFMFSDSLIAVNKFLTPVPLSGLFIMSTYYVAQFLITDNVIKEFEVSNRGS